MPVELDMRPTIFPKLYYNDAPAALEWLVRVYGFTARLVVPGAPGKIIHAELSFGEGVIMLGSARPEAGLRSPQDLPGSHQVNSVYVTDPDAHYARAAAAGAEIVNALYDAVHGRGYETKDLEGHVWSFGNYRPGVAWSDSDGEAEDV
jgi:uncharacterized glyoxalase superfamily protein PhnB